ncbi:MAG: response regulator [Bacteroidetes bacterium]|nr:response regulator [Bacteroidota bacterium]
MSTLKTKKRKIKVLIVEDSPTVSLWLEHLLNSDPEIEVIGNMPNGKLAIDFVKINKPDIITMDIDMPVMNGLDATRIIMSTTPIPIIIVTASRNAKKHNISIEALAVGALTVIQKPIDIAFGTKSEEIKKMISMVKIYSEVKVIKRTNLTETEKINVPINTTLKGNLPVIKLLENKKYIAIGISSGGPEILKMLLDSISEKFPYPVLVVQHITDGFLESMVLWLNSTSKAKIKVAKQDETLFPGHVYFAPNRYQMGVKQNRIDLLEPDGNMIICPSVSHLFNSLLLNYANKTIAMLLTGMGSDGAKELKSLKDAGSLTIAQDKESSLVHGMPGKAIELNGANYILNPEQIINVLQNIEDSFSNK